MDNNIPRNVVFRTNSSGAELRAAETALKQQFIYFLKSNFGDIASALQSLAIERMEYLYWLESDIDFRFAVACIMEDIGDMVEQKLMDKIREGDTFAITFYCKTKLKHRGYAEKADDSKAKRAGKTTVNVTVIQPKKFDEAIILEDGAKDT